MNKKLNIYVLGLEDTSSDRIRENLPEHNVHFKSFKELSETNLKNFTPDVCFLDYKAVESVGIDAVKQIKCKREHPRIIITDEENANACKATFELGFSDCMVLNDSNVKNLKYTVERNIRDFQLASKNEENQINFEAIVENDYMGIAAINEDGEFIFSNNSITKISGFTPGELKNKLFSILIHPDHIESATQKFKSRFIDTPTSDIYELKLLTKDNRVVFAEVSARLTKWGNEVVDLVFFKDITEQRMLRRTLEKNEKVLKAINVCMSILMYNTDRENAFNEVLEILGKGIDVSRVHIFENFFEEGRHATSQQYRWSDEPYIDEINDPIGKKYFFDEGFPRWEKVLNARNVIKGIVDDFPVSERNTLFLQSIKSIFVAPIFIKGSFWGFIGFDDCKENRIWDDIETNVLQTLASSIGSYIERQDAKIALEYMNNTMHAILDNINALIRVTDIDEYKVLFTNRYSKKNFDDHVGNTCWKIFDKHQDQPCDFCTSSRLIDKNGLPSGIVEYEIYNEKLKLWFHCFDSAIYWTDGKIAKLEVAIDITDRKKAEEEINFNYDFLNTLMDTIQVPIYYRTLDGVFTGMNNICASKIFGSKKEDIIGRNMIEFTDVISLDVLQKFKSRDSELLFTKKDQNYDAQLKCADGNIRYFKFSKSLYLDSENKPTGIVGALVDISDIKQAESDLKKHAETLEASRNIQKEYADRLRSVVTELEKAKRAAEEANKAKSNFLANMSHEIRTPMNAILGFTEIMLTRAKEPTNQKYLGTIYSSGKTLLSIINDILDLSKIEADKLELHYHPVDLEKLLREVRDLFETKIEEKNLKLEMIIGPSLPAAVLLDEIRLRQILFNLVGNAIKFTHKGYIKISLFYNTLMNNNSQLIFEVEDSGIGIPQNQQKIIFEAFRQQSSQDTRKYGGTGLGLTITKRLVENMHGKLSLESEEESGSLFRVIFPDVEIAKKTKYVTTAQDISFDNISFHNAKLLSVDDIEFNRDLIRSFLSTTELEVHDAKNGKEAIEALQEFSPDFILMDLKMPVMDGYTATKTIKDIHGLSDIPIIAISASSMQEDEERINVLFDGFLRKPVTRKELINKLKEHLKFKEKEGIKKIEEIVEQELEIEDDISAEVVKRAEELISILENEYSAKFKKLSKILILSKVDEMALSLSRVASNFGFKLLKNYSEALRNAANSADIELIKKLISQFSEVIKKLRILKEERNRS
jgi:PAS domain S-box-containing protein